MQINNFIQKSDCSIFLNLQKKPLLPLKVLPDLVCIFVECFSSPFAFPCCHLFFLSSMQMFPYSLLAMAVLMYLPALIWRQLVMPSLGSDLLFIIDELDKSYNRSIRLAQSILDMQQNTKNPLTFQAELQR